MTDRARSKTNGGVCYVDRIDAGDTAQPEEVEAFVGRFLDKLTR